MQNSYDILLYGEELDNKDIIASEIEIED